MTKLEVKQSGDRYTLTDGGLAIFPLIMNVVPLYGWRRDVWEPYYTSAAEDGDGMSLWAEEHAKLLKDCGVTALGLYTDFRISAYAPTLWSAQPLCIGKDHEKGKTDLYTDHGWTTSALVKILDEGIGSRLRALSRHGMDPKELKVIFDWSEPIWGTRSSVTPSKVAPVWKEYNEEAIPRLRGAFPNALIASPREAYGVHKDEMTAGWVGRTTDPGDPRSHFWAYMRAGMPGREVCCWNAYGDRQQKNLSMTSAGLEELGFTGAIAITESQWGVIDRRQNFKRWLSWRLSERGAGKKFRYPIGGTTDEAVDLFGKDFMHDARSHCTVATSIYGWYAHDWDDFPWYWGKPFGPMDPFKEKDGREYRDLRWVEGISEGIAAARKTHLALL